MSAPDTNVEKQKRKHKPVPVGIAAEVGLVFVPALGIAVWIDENRSLQGALPVDPPTAQSTTSEG